MQYYTLVFCFAMYGNNNTNLRSEMCENKQYYYNFFGRGLISSVDTMSNQHIFFC